MFSKNWNENQQNQIALWSVRGIGVSSFWRIIRGQIKDEVAWQDVWANKNNILESYALNERQINSIKKFYNEQSKSEYLNRLDEQQVSVVFFDDFSYPRLLKFISDPPPLLFIKGKFDWGVLPLAMVGTRHATAYADQAIDQILTGFLEFADTKPTIISGFMYGVDRLAQEKAQELDFKTVGWLAFGFDHMYPASHYQLFNQMLAKGATFISEFPPFVAPYKSYFPRRNRLIAGMAVATIVVEAAQRSGSHITASYALEYGREVMAVPGSIINPYSEGTKNLINEGAALINNAADIMDLLVKNPLLSLVNSPSK